MNKLIKKYQSIDQPVLLDSFIKMNSYPPLDSIAFAEVYDDFAEKIGVSADFLINKIMKNKPFLYSVLDTMYGRIGVVLLPVKNKEVYISDSLLSIINEGISFAKSCGAKCASLTGLLPSATDYGNDIVQYARENGNSSFSLTTGHGSTIAAIVINIESILYQVKRNINKEVVSYVGLGSIGILTLNLMLLTLSHPKKIILCDLFSRRVDLEKIRDSLIINFGYDGEIHIAVGYDSNGHLPRIIYDEATLIIGATNVPNIVSTKLLKPGTIIIDDSAPHIFDLESCLSRFKNKKDILVLQAGKVTLPITISSILNDLEHSAIYETKTCDNRNEIMGCTFGSILPLVSIKTCCTIGLVDLQIANAYYVFFLKEKVSASSLQCGQYYYTTQDLYEFQLTTSA